MANKGPCIIDGCSKPAHSRGWCRMHYMRWWEHGDPGKIIFSQSPAGAPLAFLEDAKRYTGDDCLLWPYSTNNRGYPQLYLGDHKVLAHRAVCDAINGPPPTPAHEAAHSCANGHLGCITPRHLRWATKKENMAEMVSHGHSHRGARHPLVKLTEKQVLEIYRRVAQGEIQTTLAAEFGVCQNAISHIKTGKRWGWLTSPKVLDLAADMIGVTPADLRKAEAA